MENVLLDIRELEKGMNMTRKEAEGRSNPPLILKDFLTNSEDKMSKLNADAKIAQDAYNGVVEYYGENAKTLPPNTFFSLFVRFVKAYKVRPICLYHTSPNYNLAKGGGGDSSFTKLISSYSPLHN